MACKVGIIIYAILQFAAFLLILVGTPIDMFRLKSEKKFYSNTQCVTMWGWKAKCYSTKYNMKPAAMFSTCTGRVDCFRAAEAFAIINIIVYGVACLMGFILLCCCSCLRWICLVLNIFGLTSVVSWAIMANAYSTTSGNGLFNCSKLSRDYHYGAGFALIVTAWCVNVVDIVFLMLPC